MAEIGANFEGPGVEAFSLQRALITEKLTVIIISSPDYHVDPNSPEVIANTKGFLPKIKAYIVEK